jgi:hypothetical protein
MGPGIKSRDDSMNCIETKAPFGVLFYWLKFETREGA